MTRSLQLRFTKLSRTINYGSEGLPRSESAPVSEKQVGLNRCPRHLGYGC
jgi:hypothetical protein